MAKFGKKEEKQNNIVQIAIVLSEDGEYNTGIQVAPGYEIKAAHLMLCFTNGLIFKSLMNKLGQTQPHEAKKISEIIKDLIESESEEPLVRPTQFANNMAKGDN